MLSSEGKPTDTTGKQVPSGTRTQWEQGLEREQIFRLIESTLSFEACLYHQILPLKIEDNSLLLLMVNPQDNAALDYVNRILSYINCSMETQAITGDTHRTILSAYLNYKNTLGSAANAMGSSWDSVAEEKGSATIQGKPTTPMVNAEKEGGTSGTSQPNSLHLLHLPVLEVLCPVEELPALPPKKLLEQLLGRVLVGGIGRLYLERQPYHGRILWSENGVLQSVLEKVPLFVFQGVLNELKRLASLPITTVVEPKQVEKECLYQQNRLLLRFRVMPGMYGEEATLQVLRGAALKFYQQQQLTRLSCDALGISQQLNYKLHELKERLILNYNLTSGQLEAFNVLNRLLKSLDYQIKIITELPELPKTGN